MNLIGYSSRTYAIDQSNGIDIVGPDYTTDRSILHKYCQDAYNLNMSIVLNLRIVDVECFTEFFAKKGITLDSVGKYNKKGFPELIHDLHYDKTVTTALKEEEIVAFFNTIDLKTRINVFLAEFSRYNIFAVYLYEEVRSWIPLEFAYLRRCNYFVKKYIKDNNKDWKIMLYHPNNTLDSALTFETELSFKFSMSRILSFIDADIASFGLHYKIDPTKTRTVMCQKLHFLSTHKYFLQTTICPVLLLESQVNFEQTVIEKIILHDFVLCAVSQIQTVFVWSFAHKPDKCNLENFVIQQQAYYKAYNFINKIENGWSIHDMCNKYIKSDKRFLENGLYVATFHHVNYLVEFTINSTHLKIEDIEPFDYKLVKEYHPAKIEEKENDNYRKYYLIPLVMTLMVLSIPFILFYFGNKHSVFTGGGGDDDDVE